MAQRRGAARVDELVEAGARDEVQAKLSQFVRSRWFEPPFGGERFSNLILDALEAMAAGGGDGRLLPDGQPLDLFVTVTDFRGHPERLELHSPAEVMETEHRLVIPFSDHGAGAIRRPCRTDLRRARDIELSRRVPAVLRRASSTACSTQRSLGLADARRFPRTRVCRASLRPTRSTPRC